MEEVLGSIVARQPGYEMGLRVAELLPARREGTAPRGCQEVVFPAEIEVHHSSESPVSALGAIFAAAAAG